MHILGAANLFLPPLQFPYRQTEANTTIQLMTKGNVLKSEGDLGAFHFSASRGHKRWAGGYPRASSDGT